MLINKRFILIYAIISIIITNEINAIVFERRKSNNQDIFEYYFLITPIERPGFGSLIAVGSIVNNLPVPWIKNGKFNLIGGFGKGKGENEFEGQDIDAYGLTIIDFPIFSNDFTFSPARLAATKYYTNNSYISAKYIKNYTNRLKNYTYNLKLSHTMKII